MKETFDDIWNSLPPYVMGDDGDTYWLAMHRSVAGVCISYENGEGEVHYEERHVHLMSKPINKKDDEPTKALSMFRDNYKAWLPE
ncbi:MAG: hypothetical protein KAS32_11060 [Candidatus Peribacteraceae bacterium]|nr:hypothetical protein [Candidatus Peribacteraceae bacterium]